MKIYEYTLINKLLFAKHLAWNIYKKESGERNH